MSPRKPLNYYLMKANRIVVWVLLLFMILLLVTGYGLANPDLIANLTGGLITFYRAAYWHRLLDFPLAILLVFHVVVELKFSLMRWGFKHQKLLNLLMLLLASSCLVLIAYLEGSTP